LGAKKGAFDRLKEVIVAQLSIQKI